MPLNLMAVHICTYSCILLEDINSEIIFSFSQLTPLLLSSFEQQLFFYFSSATKFFLSFFSSFFCPLTSCSKFYCAPTSLNNSVCLCVSTLCCTHSNLPRAVRYLKEPFSPSLCRSLHLLGNL